MPSIFAWVALAATSIAAIMTAANLGARMTGFGFAVFLVGAVAWCVVGAQTGQAQLLWSNVFLALVDLFGIWRWLYRRARADDAVDRAQGGNDGRNDNLFAVTELIGKAIRGRGGVDLGTVEGVLADCRSGATRFLVVRPADGEAGASAFRRMSWHGVRATDDALLSDLTPDDLDRLERC